MTALEFRAALKALGLTQRGFAERLGVTTTATNNWAMGRQRVPRFAAYALELLAQLQQRDAA